MHAPMRSLFLILKKKKKSSMWEGINLQKEGKNLTCEILSRDEMKNTSISYFQANSMYSTLAETPIFNFNFLILTEK